MMRVRASGFHMRPRVGAELPFCQWGECQKQLSRHQQTNRRQPECRWKDAGATIKAHHE
jgi:hypothetical protein